MHAYLIMAHNNQKQLIKLLELLDYEYNDIYIHIDKKANCDLIEFNYAAYCKKSKVYTFSEFKINWGSSNQIKCELFLLEKAINTYDYDYYHLLSGSDLPLKSQEEIHLFFAKNKGNEFINFSKPRNKFDIIDRVKYYHISDYFDILPYMSFKIMRRLDKYQIVFQKLLFINRIKNFDKLYKGANWFSITNELAKSLVAEKNNLLNKYKYTLCCDEVFLQTYVYNHPHFLEKVYKLEYSDANTSIFRNIDWTRGGPYVWRVEDYDELIHSNCLFARKFDENIDNTIIELIYKEVLNRG